MKESNGRLKKAQQVHATERPPVLQQHVVLLLNADAGQPAQHIKTVRELLKLDELDLPRPLLLRNNCLQRHGGIAMSATRIVEYNVYFLHGGHCTYASVSPRGALLMPCG